MDLLLAPSTPSEEGGGGEEEEEEGGGGGGGEEEEEEEKEKEEELEGEEEEGLGGGQKGEEWRVERLDRGNGKLALCWRKSVQKREKYWLISLLRAMGRRQEESKCVSTWIIKHKAVGSWDGVGEREV